MPAERPRIRGIRNEARVPGDSAREWYERGREKKDEAQQTNKYSARRVCRRCEEAVRERKEMKRRGKTTPLEYQARG